MQTIGIGTEKGGFIARRTTDGFDITGPLFPGWKVTTWGRTPGGAYLAALGSNWFGPAVQRSTDLEEWEQVPGTPTYPEGGPKLEQIWRFRPEGDRLYAGVAEAGLFRSDDDGLNWEPVAAINEHPQREHWHPGLGGLAAHHILTDGERVVVGISAVGVFRSDDRGETFEPADDGVTNTVTDPRPGWCVHGLVADPDDPDRIWRQDHSGVYRTTNGGRRWERIEEGLPSRFGFPVVRDDASGRLFVVPLTSDENRLPVDGRFRVWRSDDDGDSWHESGTGWPDGATWTAVLRGAMDVDGDGGVVAGTTSGDLWLTEDAGDTWTALPADFPRILSVCVLD